MGIKPNQRLLPLSNDNILGLIRNKPRIHRYINRSLTSTHDRLELRIQMISKHNLVPCPINRVHLNRSSPMQMINYQHNLSKPHRFIHRYHREPDITDAGSRAQQIIPVLSNTSGTFHHRCPRVRSLRSRPSGGSLAVPSDSNSNNTASR